MKVEAVVVGNELLNGDLADTNTASLGRLLRTHGLRLLAAQTVPDDLEAIGAALAQAAARADLVLVSGGLGPTEDDITLAAAAKARGLAMVRDEGYLQALKGRFEARGFPFTDNNAKQADHPEGAILLANAKGTAPGVRMQWGEATLFFFPGVPRELLHLAESHLVAWLRDHAVSRSYESVLFKTFGHTESMVSQQLSAIAIPRDVHVAYRAHFPEINVSLHLHASSQGEAEVTLEAVAADVRRELGHLVFTEDPKGTLASVVLDQLRSQEETLALAESCTGGLLAKMLTDIPGSSQTLVEGIVAYSNDSKISRLDVPIELIEAHGAVSGEVARAMSEGVRRRAGTDWGVGITGIAGPGGGSKEKPVGTVHVAVSNATRTWHVWRRFPFGRSRTRLVTAYTALDMIRRFEAQS